MSTKSAATQPEVEEKTGDGTSAHTPVDPTTIGWLQVAPSGSLSQRGLNEQAQLAHMLSASNTTAPRPNIRTATSIAS